VGLFTRAAQNLFRGAGQQPAPREAIRPGSGDARRANAQSTSPLSSARTPIRPDDGAWSTGPPAIGWTQPCADHALG